MSITNFTGHSRMAMFDIKDSDKVRLNDNKSADPTLLKAENVKSLHAAGNEAGVKSVAETQTEHSKFRAFCGNLLTQVIAGVLLIVIGALLVYFWPTFFSK